MQELITPNWHVVILHYPIVLVTLGFLLELGGGRRPDSPVRRAGRWMLLFGAILAIPTATSGIYALRDVMIPGALALHLDWPALTQQCKLTPEQWGFIRAHLLYNSIGSALLLLLVCTYVGSSNRGRRSIYGLCLFALLLAFAAFMYGAWNGGELVYRCATAVVPPSATEGEHGIEFYLPPLQLHVILAGLVVSMAALAAALSIRRWNVAREALEAPVEHAAVVTPTDPQLRSLPAEPLPHIKPGSVVPPTTCPGLHVVAGRTWIAGTVLGLLAAVCGVWSVAGGFTPDALRSAYEETMRPEHRRLLVHVVCGLALVLLPLIAAGAVRFAPRRLGLLVLPCILLFAIAAWQVWLGITLLYDSPRGPWLSFNTTSSVLPVVRPAEGRR